MRILLPKIKGKEGNTMTFGPNHRIHPGFVLTDFYAQIFTHRVVAINPSLEPLSIPLPGRGLLKSPGLDAAL